MKINNQFSNNVFINDVNPLLEKQQNNTNTQLSMCRQNLYLTFLNKNKVNDKSERKMNRFKTVIIFCKEPPSKMLKKNIVSFMTNTVKF